MSKLPVTLRHGKHPHHHSSEDILQLALLLLIANREELGKDVAPADQVVELLGCEIALCDQALQTRVLLLGITRVRANLLGDLDVVVRVLVLETFRSLLDLVVSGSVGTLGVGNNGVESFDGTTESVEATANSTVCASVRVEELDEVALAAGTLVWKRLGGALLEVLDGGV